MGNITQTTEEITRGAAVGEWEEETGNTDSQELRIFF